MYLNLKLIIKIKSFFYTIFSRRKHLFIKKQYALQKSKAVIKNTKNTILLNV